MTHIATAPHEVRGTLVWNQHGDSPYWALRTLTTKADGGGTWTLPVDVPGEPDLVEMEVSLGYQVSGVASRPSDDVDELHEYRVRWEYDGISYGGLIQPRFKADEFRQAHRGDRPDRAWHEREKIQVPPALGEATAFKIEAGTYAEPDFYARMLPRVLRAIADHLEEYWDHEYFGDGPLPQLSTITDYERTVRYSRDASKKVTRQDGVMHRIWQLLSGLEGSKREYSADDTEVEGYIHQLRLDRTAASELFPGNQQRYGVQLKSYHPQNVRGQDEADDALYSPRFGVLMKKKWNDRHGVPWCEVDQLSRELEETLVNVLAWAGVPVDPDSTTFIADDHFDVQASHRSVGFYDDPTPEIRAEQDSLMVRTFAELTDTDLEALDQLAADGGETHYGELSSETGRAISTIYRVLERCPMLESNDGMVGFVSERIRQEVSEIVSVQADQLTTAADAVVHLLNLDRETLRQRGGALQRWLTEYAVELVDAGQPDGASDRVTFKIASMLDRLRSTDVPLLDDVLQEGKRAWANAGLDVEEFNRAIVEWENTHGETVRRPVGTAIR